jgi:hypothetical protein
MQGAGVDLEGMGRWRGRGDIYAREPINADGAVHAVCSALYFVCFLFKKQTCGLLQWLSIDSPSHLAEPGGARTRTRGPGKKNRRTPPVNFLISKSQTHPRSPTCNPPPPPPPWILGFFLVRFWAFFGRRVQKHH